MAGASPAMTPLVADRLPHKSHALFDTHARHGDEFVPKFGVHIGHRAIGALSDVEPLPALAVGRMDPRPKREDEDARRSYARMFGGEGKDRTPSRWTPPLVLLR